MKQNNDKHGNRATPFVNYTSAFQPFLMSRPTFRRDFDFGPLHEKFVSELMTRRNYGDETIFTLTISSGTRDPKSQPFLYTAKSKRASATAGAPISKSHKKRKLLKRGKRSDASLRM